MVLPQEEEARTQAHTEGTLCEDRTAISKPRGVFSESIIPLSLSLSFDSHNCVKLNFCCLRHTPVVLCYSISCKQMQLLGRGVCKAIKIIECYVLSALVHHSVLPSGLMTLFPQLLRMPEI